MTNSNHLIHILVVDDNAAQANLAKLAFNEGRFSKKIHIVSNGEDALNFLRKKRTYEQVPFPDLIILDLKMPNKEGWQVLKEIKNDPDIQNIPVLILSSSETQEDVRLAYKLGANGYVRKPDNFDRFIKVAQGIEEFWFDIAILPRN